MRWIYHEMKASRLVKFLLVHGVISIVAGAMIIKSFTHNQGTIFPRYFITFVEAFLGSFAGALMSLVLLLKDLFLGYAGTGITNLFGHPVPMPVLAGVAALFAFIFLITGIRAYNSMVMYPVFAISSVLFMASAYICFVEMASVTSHLLGL